MKRTNSKSVNDHRHVQTRTTPRGVRIVQNGVVLSEVLDRPGPTHSVVDAIAAAARVLNAGPRLALLGFEGGGMLAPLRAMGGKQRVEAVDISRRNKDVFERLCGKWCGEVRFHLKDAETWLSGVPGKFDTIVEDISVSTGGDVVQPEFIWTTLPQRIRFKLSPDGVAVFNLLKPATIAWNVAIGRIAETFETVHIVLFQEYENRLVIGGNHNRSARDLSLGMRRELKRIGSRLATRISVSTCANPSSG